MHAALHNHRMSITPTAAKPSLTMRVAEEVRALMARRRMTGAELARRLGVSQMWISYRLNGRQPIDLDDLERIARVLGVQPLDLLRSAESGSTLR
jgi:transcriptional regulator with XRE-family HTH domain